MLRAFDRCSCCLRSVRRRHRSRAPPSRSICCWCSPPTCRAASISAKFQLQREGYAAAIADKRVLEAITAGRHRRIAVALRRMVGRQRAEGRDRLDRDRRARRRAEVRRPARSNCRARSPSAPRSAAASISPWRCWSARPIEAARRTIDVSGDGTNNSGRDVTLARDEARGQGRHHQRPGDPERPADGLESRAHQSARRACELLPQQRDRRARRVRDRGREFQFVRPGHRQEADRRDRRRRDRLRGIKPGG